MEAANVKFLLKVATGKQKEMPDTFSFVKNNYF